MKKIFYTNEAREKVLSGAKQLYDAVKVTFGPKGQNVYHRFSQRLFQYLG